MDLASALARQFFVDPTHSLLVYGAEEESTLRDDLAAHESDTVIETVESPSQLLLDQQGRTLADGYSYSWPAFRQASRFFCKGLGAVLSDLSGYAPGKVAKDISFYSINVATELFNRVLAQRFDHCGEGLRLLISTANRRIDAVVGRAYQRISNFEFFERVTGAVYGNLSSAATIGRRLIFYRTTTQAEPISDDPRFATMQFGVMARNNEGGDASMAICPSMRFNGSNWLVRPGCRVTSIRHAGASFIQKFSAAIESSRPHQAWRDRLAVSFENLQNSSLNFTERTDYATDVHRYRRLVEEVSTAGLTSSFCRRVVRRALASGGVDGLEFGQQLFGTRDRWSTRTKLDMLAALSIEASETDNPGVRERAESRAYRMLCPRIDQEIFHVSSSRPVRQQL